MSFERSTLLTSFFVVLTRDVQHLLLGHGNDSNVHGHVCKVCRRLKSRRISNIPSPTVTDDEVVLLSFGKEHALLSLREEDMG